jgi:hypothetical protein
MSSECELLCYFKRYYKLVLFPILYKLFSVSNIYITPDFGKSLGF